MQQQSVCITGVGIISSLGTDLKETISSFEEHRSGIAERRYLQTRHGSTFPLAEVKYSNEELATRSGLDPRLSRTILLSYIAAKQALDTVPVAALPQLRIGFISGNTVGGMDLTESYFEDFLQDPQSGDLRKVMNHDCGKPTDFVAEKLGIGELVTTISTACSSSANAIMLGSRLIKSGRLDMVIAGGVDALTKFTLNGFNSLMIVDTEQCRPLDSSRVGLNLGEGAAYVVLTTPGIAQLYGLTTWCKVAGYCNTNDSHHQTALSDDGIGPYLAMTGALKDSGLTPSDISYINMHGTGTQNNDSAEGRAVERIFHPHFPMLSSTKSFTGHTLGASGSVEAVFSAYAIKEGVVYPNFKFNEPVEGLSIRPETAFKRNLSINHVLSNSFGFGGNCTALVFSKV